MLLQAEGSWPGPRICSSMPSQPLPQLAMPSWWRATKSMCWCLCYTQVRQGWLKAVVSDSECYLQEEEEARIASTSASIFFCILLPACPLTCKQHPCQACLPAHLVWLVCVGCCDKTPPLPLFMKPSGVVSCFGNCDLPTEAQQLLSRWTLSSSCVLAF